MGSPTFVAMGAILSFFFPPADTAPDTSDTKEDESGVKEVEKEVEKDVEKEVKKEGDSEKADTKKTPEMTDATVTVPKITEEAMEEADYEVVETSDPSTLSAAGFPRTPQNSFANLPSLPSAGQLDDGFEVISQRTEESTTSLLNVDNTAAVVENKEAKEKEEEEEEESPIANLKSGVEALLTDLSASAAGPEQEEESVSTTTTSSVVKEETSTTTIVQQEVQSIGEVEDNAKEATKTEETMES